MTALSDRLGLEPSFVPSEWTVLKCPPVFGVEVGDLADDVVSRRA